MNLDSKIADMIISQLSIEELEAILERKKQEKAKSSIPVKLTEKQKIKNYCMDFLKKKLYAPKYK